MEMTFNVEVPKHSELLGVPIRLGGQPVGTVVAYVATDRPSSVQGMEIVEVTVVINEPVPAQLQPFNN